MTEQTAEPYALKPVHVRIDEGEARWWFGGLAVLKATAADTGGQLTIVEVTEPPGEAPLHVHHRDDEAFWILEGDVTFEVGEATIAASAGDYVFAPRGIPHRYTVAAATGRGAQEPLKQAVSWGSGGEGFEPSTDPEARKDFRDRLKSGFVGALVRIRQ